ncbi:MAG: hypothetical protein A3A33_03510 [Candidatus Yanofskybacteria bacterium RIFCSPLOWO2_01_FULL_49_25]|uniref:ABC transporter ATP-binding protein n=1 Tax=Candidatus Yanofskybacteria bacterium RIFCSPLOWO2_01_FULL_49_25 TaxID=1802701 RepID=A0A1F8GVV6_9BACT|nr:MAG: hypothetical protein A3A33_03510 [Candidatus Yanofskybacteria bacterium RIFCSPLOWO2_01_FULL_49_25]
MAQPSYRTIVRYYWMQMRKHRGYFAMVFVMYAIGVVFAGLITPLLYRHIIDVLAASPDPLQAWPTLVRLLIYVGATMIIYNAAYRLGDFAIVRFESKTMKDLMDFAFTGLTRHSYRFFTNSFAGSLVTKVKRFVRSFEDAFDAISFVFWMTVVRISGVIIVLFITAPFLAILFLGWTVLYILFAWYLTKKKIPLDLAESTADSRVTGRLADVITNVLNLKMFSSRTREISDFVDITEDERKARHRAWTFGNKINIIQAVFFALLEFSSMAIALYMWRNGLISAGTVVLILIYLIAMFESLWDIGKAMGRVSQKFADASELVEILETPIDIQDIADPETINTGSGEIIFDHVSFRYGKKTNRVFADFSLHISAGQRIGLVGSSGAGKSTITKLLLRFADVEKGKILIDGQNIAGVRQDDLRSKIAYVPQDPILFHRTLYENIAYGKPNASKEEILEAAKKAHAHEFISKFPQGYETLVGERGIKLSGGERQRVAIARAMLKNAPILILDEATSSLDSVSEKYIQEALHELMKNRTTIVIAHRLSTIQGLDRIVVLEHGKIVEDGTHTELMKEKGVYANFWQHQTASFIK